VNQFKRHNEVPLVSEIDGAGIVVLIGLFILFYFTALKPLLERRQMEQVQQQELELQRTKADLSAQALQTASEHLKTIKAAISDSPQKLEPVKALNDRLARIAALATARGLDIADIRPGDVAAAVHYTTVPISLTGTGGFPNCVRYMHELHQQFSDTTVTSMRLTGNPDDLTAAGTFQLELRWYAAPQRSGAVSSISSGEH
jgi:Tfp pilus assembly protein PilO